MTCLLYDYRVTEYLEKFAAKFAVSQGDTFFTET